MGAPHAISAVIFDLDGTLLNTLSDLANSMNLVLKEMGFPPHPQAAYRHFVGDGMSQLVKRVLPPDTPPEAKQTCREKMLREYARSWNRETRPYNGVPDMLAFLAAGNLPLAVLSNKPDEFTVRMCRHFFHGFSFAAVQGFIDTVPRKPDPTGAINIARKISLPPEQILYLGDTATDMECAVAAGMIPAGVLWGFRDEEELRNNGAIHILSHPMDITNLF